MSFREGVQHCFAEHPPLLVCLKWFCGTWNPPSPLLRKFSPTMSKIGLFALYKDQQWNDHQPSRDHACPKRLHWRNHFWNSAYPGSTNWARKNLWALPRPRVSFRRWGDCKHCTPQNLSLVSQSRENVEKKVSFHLPLFLGCRCILLEALIQSKLKGDFLFLFSFVMNSVIAKLFVEWWSEFHNKNIISKRSSFFPRNLCTFGQTSVMKEMQY